MSAEERHNAPASPSDISAWSTPTPSIVTTDPHPAKLKLEDEKDSSARVERRFNALNNDSWIYPGAVESTGSPVGDATPGSLRTVVTLTMAHSGEPTETSDTMAFTS
ncbi:hypothetical protein C8J56DRAFT_1061411 [Mycena floridula]|nr:hypothetical protein C8J56DRAFT_1061411 [Mycena floridula]